METLGDDLVAKSSKKVAFNFYCEKCDYNCSKKYNWDKHLSTTKHTQVTVGDGLVAKVAKSGKNNSIYSCEICNKEYSSRNGLWKHKKICLTEQKTNDDISTKDLVLMLFQQNNKVQDALIEMSKQINTTNNTTNNTNSHNKTTNNSFNLQFFLNETCKNAMNITDFVDSIKLQLSDLINVGELGYVDGISNIIVKNLSALDVTERPVHCTDKKRETIYIKDEDKWEKDENDKKIRKLIKNVAYKNQKLFPQFKEKYPDYNDSDSKYSDQYSKIVIESLADNDIQKEDKIIKNISKVITIDKIKNEI
jgi:protein-tyrosine phosphatase